MLVQEYRIETFKNLALSFFSTHTGTKKRATKPETPASQPRSLPPDPTNKLFAANPKYGSI